MNKFLLLSVVGLGLLNTAFADNTSMPNNEPPRMNPVCQPAFDYLKSTHPQLKSAIAANDANKVGTIVIANHKYMQSFIQQHPECKPHRRMMPMQDFN